MNSSKSWIVITIILAVLLCAIASYVNRPLPAYIDSPSASPSSEEIELPQMQPFQKDTITFEYPNGWTQTMKNGHPFFINSDGTYFMLQESDYQPTINNATETSIKNELAAAGYQPLSFEKITSSSFLFSYQSGQVVTWEYVVWDRNTEVRLICAYEADRAEIYKDTIAHILDSFAWEKPEPIPEQLIMHYNEFGNFEFAVPCNWVSGISSESFSATNTDTGSVYSVTVSQTALDSLKDISEIQYAQEALRSRSNLFIKSYGASASQVTAESIYTFQGTQMLFYHVMEIREGYLYEFLLDAPMASGEADYHLFLECLKYFRTFGK